MAKPFTMNYRVNTGPRGNPAAWRAAFSDRLGLEAAIEAVGADSPEGILGVRLDTDWPAIQTAYRKLARQHHPDLGGDPAQFRRIQAAYEVLEDRYK